MTHYKHIQKSELLIGCSMSNQIQEQKCCLLIHSQTLIKSMYIWCTSLQEPFHHIFLKYNSITLIFGYVCNCNFNTNPLVLFLLKSSINWLIPTRFTFLIQIQRCYSHWNWVRINADIPWILKINEIHQNIPHLDYFPKREGQYLII